MKTAIIYTGALRSFDKCLPNHRYMVHRHFPGAKFYIACHRDEDAHKADLLVGATVRGMKQPEMIAPAGCPTEWHGPGKPYMHEPYSISVSPQAVLGQLWMLRQGWQLYLDANEPADLIIRIRPDLWFHSYEHPDKINDWIFPSVAYCPWWGQFGGINDRFALLGRVAASAYFTTYGQIPSLVGAGAPLHPESLVHAALYANGCYAKANLKTEFSTLRKSGEYRPPEIFSWDLAHVALSR